MGMGMSMGLVMNQSLTQKQAVAMPNTNWSLVDAYDTGEGRANQFDKKKIEGIDKLSLEERLKAVDNANEVFRYAYTQAEDDKGNKGKYYKIPLMRDRNIDIEDIKIPISRKEYLEATAVLEGAGRLQRIVRAVPYDGLRKEVQKYLEEKGIDQKDIVVVGVDRGGRVPTLIIKEALGKDIAYFLKVDQGGGRIDPEKIDAFAKREVFKGKHILFIDSTVDSGRQINALHYSIEDPETKARLGHTGWTVVGSNESGATLHNHLNVNWGLDPDSSFEDNPNLMGVDYAFGSHTRVRATPSKTSTEIRNAILEVPKGIILDTTSALESLINQEDGLRRAKKDIRTALQTKGWQKASPYSRETWVEEFSTRVSSFQADIDKDRKRLAIIGSGNRGMNTGLGNESFINGERIGSLEDSQVEFLAQSLIPYFTFKATTDEGNPGQMISAAIETQVDGSATLYTHARGGYSHIGVPTIFIEGDKQSLREDFIRKSDAILALGGGKGTLTEAIMALHAKKPVVVVKNFGAVGRFLSSSRKFKEFDNLYLVDSLLEAAEKLKELKKSL